jgi:hypothetical protein
MMLLALLVGLLVVASCVGIYAEPKHWPPSPDRHERDYDLRKRLWR